ncbi:NAD(P)H-binding protein [Taibaiella soli]|uniref:Semialdehyde dehydrogenase n=1 Tax=Taibaiella soli TaxID=1649169 RepID=A0A2W2BXU3_9BACT|nr:NAD(P)H-binding protein [Taibaiella soli]PZF72673.1 semialdehyde dehydrogenase [Taibaiella soli]
MKALIIGATGATGKDLTEALLQDNDYTEVVVFVRKATGISHPKLSEIIADFDNLETVAGQINGDVWFSCLGSTLKTAGSKEKQWAIDYDIPVRFATIARRNGVNSAVLLSSYGAAAKSKMFYSMMKGKLEEAIAELSFGQYIIFRPGLLLRKNTDRMGERVAATLLHFVNTIGLLRKLRPMPTSLLAAKLAKAPKVLGNGKHIIELNGIFSF